MLIIGCDFQTRYQIAMLDEATGELMSAGWNTRAEKHTGFTAIYPSRFEWASKPAVRPMLGL